MFYCCQIGIDAVDEAMKTLASLIIWQHFAHAQELAATAVAKLAWLKSLIRLECHNVFFGGGFMESSRSEFLRSTYPLKPPTPIRAPLLVGALLSTSAAFCNAPRDRTPLTNS